MREETLTFNIVFVLSITLIRNFHPGWLSELVDQESFHYRGVCLYPIFVVLITVTYSAESYRI